MLLAEPIKGILSGLLFLYVCDEAKDDEAVLYAYSLLP